MLVTIGGAGYAMPVAVQTSVPRSAIEECAHRFSTEEYERIVTSGALEGMRVELLAL